MNMTAVINTKDPINRMQPVNGTVQSINTTNATNTAASMTASETTNMQEAKTKTEKTYKYRPVLFFVLTYLFTWIFWIPATFVSGNLGAALMLIGLIAPAVVSTVFVLFSGSDTLKQDLKNKIIGFYKVKWLNVLWAICVFAIIVAASILLSLAFGQSLDQFSFTEDFSFTGIGIAGAFVTVTLASILEEIGWKGYCEDSIGNYMNWFWESLIFGAIWSFWHFPLIFISGTYQAGLMVNPLFVVNFFVSAIPMGYIITWVYLVSDRSILACIIFHLFVNFMQEKIAMTPETKCVETIVVIIVTVIIVIVKKDMFFETRHVGRLLETLSEDQK